ncbi:MAG TPA: rhomboid family intramembrane serine protease [Gammaproteobacteria bacterium]|nr:rhomboid family intramembrane serine protease [Gammaproteobacteria bacterium]
MFIPIHDRNPLTIIPWQFVTLALIVVNLAVFLWQNSLGEQALAAASYAWGMTPSVLWQQRLLPEGVAILPEEMTLFSYAFLHGGWLHLIGNMLFLWVFGDNIEDSMGHARFLLFYLLCALAAGLVHALMEPGSQVPLIGASGAIAGILGAYLVLHPRVKVLVLLFSRIPLHLPAWLLLSLWFVFQFVSLSITGGADNTAWWAHIGGFLAGMILIVPMRYKRVPLFDRGVEH